MSFLRVFVIKLLWREHVIQSRQTVRLLCERALACNGKLDELERFFNRNLTDRGAKHASKFSKIYELVKRVTTTPMENLIGVSCNDNMTERLRLLCLLFDFSRKEGE